jgi:hypothetical protein
MSTRDPGLYAHLRRAELARDALLQGDRDQMRRGRATRLAARQPESSRHRAGIGARLIYCCPPEQLSDTRVRARRAQAHTVVDEPASAARRTPAPARVQDLIRINPSRRTSRMLALPPGTRGGRDAATAAAHFAGESRRADQVSATELAMIPRSAATWPTKRSRPTDVSRARTRRRRSFRGRSIVT